MDYDPASVPCSDPLYFSAYTIIPSWVLGAIYLVVSAMILWRCIRWLTIPRLVIALAAIVVVNLILVVPGYLLRYMFDPTAITEMTYLGTYGAAIIAMAIAFTIYHVLDRIWGDGGASGPDQPIGIPSVAPKPVSTPQSPV